jgi:hypothetical protein
METRYPSNSHKARAAAQAKQAERKKLEKVVTGTVTTRKKSGAQKITDLFIAEDAKNVKSYVLFEVLVPAIKDAVYNIVCDSAGMIFGKPTGGRRGSVSTRDNYTQYWKDRDRGYQPARPRTVFDYDDIVFATRGDAEIVLNELRLTLREYGLVRVSDLYDLAGKSWSYTYRDYGWTNLERAEVVGVRGGYIIDFPRPLPID